MEMEDDEEVVLKNSGLYACLVEAGFHDFEMVEKTDSTCSSVESIISSTSSATTDNRNSHYEEFESYIQLCLQSKLVFADDASFVENYMVSSHPPPSESLILRMLKVASCAVFVGTTYRCLSTNVRQTVLFSLPAIPLAIYCIRYSFLSYEKYQRKKIVSRLLSCMKELSLFAQKSVQFVLNNSVLAFAFDKSRLDHENSTYFQEVVFTTLKSIILELKSAIISLVRDYPLKEPAELHQYHLAFLQDEDLHCVRPKGEISAEYLKKMKYTYFLMQSELLRRVCLSFMPCLQKNRSYTSISQLFQRLKAKSDIYEELCQRLKSSFEMHYLLEKVPVDENHARRQPNTNWAHREAYVKVCSLSYNLQSVLRESRRIERMLEDVGLLDVDHDRIVASLDDGARRIDLKYTKCHSALDDFRKHVLSLRLIHDRHEPPVVFTQSSLLVPEVNKTNIVVGTTDFRPQWPDEVFVGVSEVDVQPTETNDTMPESVVGAPCAKLLISELKMALLDKAEEWKQREREALKSKNVEDVSESEDELPIIKHPTMDPGHPQRPPPPALVVAPVSQDVSHLPESSFAKQIAAASASWRVREEQHFSFGVNEDHDDDTDESDE